MTVHISKVISAGDKIMPLSIGSCFSCHTGRRPEISDPIIDKPSTKNCELISTTCNVDGITVISRSSYGFDMKPPGAGSRSTAKIVGLRSSVDGSNNRCRGA